MTFKPMEITPRRVLAIAAAAAAGAMSVTPATAATAVTPTADTITLQPSDMPASGWRDIGNLHLKRVLRFQRQGAACIGAPDPSQGGDYSASDIFSSRRATGNARKQIVWSLVKVEPTEIGANQVLQAIRNTNAAACEQLVAARLGKNLSAVAKFGKPRVNITGGAQVVRVRIQMPMRMRVHRLAPSVPAPTKGGAVLIAPSKVKSQVSPNLVGQVNLPVFYDQFYAVRGRVVMLAGFVSVGAPFTATAERAWLAPMYKRAKKVPIALSSPPGTIILPPPQVIPIEPFQLVLGDPIPAGTAVSTLNYPAGWGGTSGPPITVHGCDGSETALFGISSGQMIPGTNITVVDDGPCPPPVVIVPYTPPKCHPSVLDYIDMSYMFDCGSKQPKVPVGPGATGTGQMPFIIAFPGITAS